MNRGFGGAIDGGGVHGSEAESGGDGEDVGGRLLFEVLDECGGDANRAQEIDVDDRSGLRVVHHGGGVVDLHDSRVVDDGVKFREVGDEFFANAGDAGGMFDVEFVVAHIGIGFGDFGEVAFAAAGDDDFVAELVEG